MKRSLWKKIAAVSVSAAMLFSFPASAAADVMFSSGEETVLWEEDTAEEEEVFTQELPGGSSESRIVAEEESAEDFDGAETAAAGAYIPFISTQALPIGKQDQFYSAQLEGLSHNNQRLTWRLTPGDVLPAGMALSYDGLLSGIPREQGKFLLNVIAGNGQAESTQRLELNIWEADPVLSYAMKADQEVVDFGIVAESRKYEELLGISNEGNCSLHITRLPECDNFVFSKYTESDEILVGGQYYVNVNVKENLPDGHYEEKAVIESEEGARCEVTLKINIGAASEKEYDLRIYPSPVVIEEFIPDEPEDEPGALLEIQNIGKKVTKVSKDTTMLQNFEVFDVLQEGEADNTSRLLKPGGSIYFMVVPKTLYGTFQEEFYVYTDDSAKFSVPIVQDVKEPEKPKNFIKMSSEQISFEGRYAFYEKAPGEQTITVQNISEESVTLSQQGSSGLKISSLSRYRLGPGETAQFTIQPEDGLAAGHYAWWINVRAQSDQGKSSFAYTRADFDVDDKNFAGAEDIPAATRLTNGAEKTREGLKLPKYLSVRGAGEYPFQAEVLWDVENCVYDPDDKEAQTFFVKGQLQIPPEQNNRHLDTTVEIEVRVNAYSPLGQPVIEKAAVTDNYLDVKLYDEINEAQEYQFVLVQEESDLEKDRFVKVQTSPGIQTRINYIQKGEYFLFCRSSKGEGTKISYGEWSQPEKIEVNVKTAGEPSIMKAEVRNCDVRITVSTPETVNGYDVVLAKSNTEGIPSDYVQKKLACPGNAKTITLNGAPAGTYDVGIHSYIYQNNRKVLSPWSNLVKVTVKKGKITASPVIKKTNLSGRDLTVTITLPKGASGSDWVLAKKAYRNPDGSYSNLSQYAYIQKNRTGTKITFKNMKPGTYYLSGHGYLKGYTKNFTPWAKAKKIVVK